MSNFKKLRDAYKNFYLVGQLGFSLIMPMMLCLLFCWWVIDRFGIGMWVYIPGFIIGLGSSFSTAVGFYRSFEKREIKKTKRKGVFYNRHS